MLLAGHWGLSSLLTRLNVLTVRHLDGTDKRETPAVSSLDCLYYWVPCALWAVGTVTEYNQVFGESMII